MMCGLLGSRAGNCRRFSRAVYQHFCSKAACQSVKMHAGATSSPILQHERRDDRLQLHGPGTHHGSDPVPRAAFSVFADGQQGLASAVDALAQRLQVDSMSMCKGDRQAGVADDAGWRLPDFIWRRGGRSWLNSPPQSYALRHFRSLRELIGSPVPTSSERVMVNPALLAKTLGQPVSIRRNAEAFICSAMIELFPTKHGKETRQKWKGPKMPCFR